MPILDHFGLIAPLYERVIPSRIPEEIIHLAGLPVEGALLDAGGGTGRVAQKLVGLAGQVVVADLSEGMLQQAARKQGVLPVLSLSERLPFASGSFDAVIMVDALHHVINQSQTAAELWRVLKPGGRIVIEEPDLRTLAVKFVAVAEKVALMRSHFLAPGQIKALFTPFGAKVEIEAKGWGAWVVVMKGEGRKENGEGRMDN